MQSNGGTMSIGDKVILSAVIGGTAEALWGGKFANGAVTGAIVFTLRNSVQLYVTMSQCITQSFSEFFCFKFTVRLCA